MQETGEDLDQFLGDKIEESPDKPKKKKTKEKPKSKPKPIPQPVFSSSDDDSNDGKIEILADEDYEDL